MRRLFRKFLPTSLKLRAHRIFGAFTAMRFGYPAKKLTVIAVTGTNGKSTVVSLISQMLHAAGQPVGSISTATIRIRDAETLNATKLTTPSPAFLQAKLKQMVGAGCRYAVLEASSEGLAQGRLNGIDPVIAVFTNLTPEHIESHGSFEAYAHAKEELFAKLNGARRQGKTTLAVVNIDDEHAARFLTASADRIIGCTLGAPRIAGPSSMRTLRAEQIIDDPEGARFVLDGVEIRTPFVGRFNVMNVLEAMAVVRELDVSLESIARIAPMLAPVPGRMEFLNLGLPFRVLVDYAPEPASMAALYSVLPRFNANHIIHVFGSAGGGRDRARRPVLGKYVTERADIAIITNEDPYDEDPKRIADDILVGTEQASPHRAKVESVLDRRGALARALSLARPGDLVVVTGKACEQWIMGPKGEKTPWDDRRVLREIAEEIRRDTEKK